MEAGRLWMVYVNVHKPISPRDFSVIADLFGTNISKNVYCITIIFRDVVVGDVSFQMHPRML